MLDWLSDEKSEKWHDDRKYFFRQAARGSTHLTELEMEELDEVI